MQNTAETRVTIATSSVFWYNNAVPARISRGQSRQRRLFMPTATFDVESIKNSIVGKLQR